MRRTLVQMGQGACPCWATCLPMLGTLLAPSGHDNCPDSAQIINGTRTLVKVDNKRHQNRRFSVEKGWYFYITSILLNTISNALSHWKRHDTSMILQWHFSVKHSEKYHWVKSLAYKVLETNSEDRMILWHFVLRKTVCADWDGRDVTT